MEKKLPSWLVRIIALIIFVAVFGLVYFFYPNTNSIDNKITLPPIQKSQENTITGTIKQAPTSPETDKNADTTTVEKLSETEKNTILIKINNQEYSFNIKEKETLLDVMRLLTADSRQPFTFSGKDYPGMGFFVEEINGQKNDSSKNLFWVYYINGRSAEKGISLYEPKPNDSIEWKLETSKF